MERPLHERSGALVAFLAELRCQIHCKQGNPIVCKNEHTGGLHMDASMKPFFDTLAPSSMELPQLIEALAVMMYEFQVLGEKDVILAQAWLEDLVSVGYAKKFLAQADKRTETTPTTATQTASAPDTMVNKLTPMPAGDADGSIVFSESAQQLRSLSNMDTVSGHERQGRTVEAIGEAIEITGNVSSEVRHITSSQPAMPSIVELNESASGGTNKRHVLLVIAVVSIRPDRRSAIRDSWLLWGSDDVVVRPPLNLLT